MGESDSLLLLCTFLPYKARYSIRYRNTKRVCFFRWGCYFHAWIEDVIAKEETYTKLFSKEEIADLFKEDEKKNSFTPTILFKEGALATLSLQFWQLQIK